MSRDILIALGAGLLSALFYLSVKTGSPGAFIFAYLSQLPLFAVGLSRGTVAGFVACAVATAVLLVGANLTAAGLFLLLTVGPVALIVRLGLLSRPGPTQGQMEWYPPGMILGWLTVYGLVMLVGTAIFFASTPGGIEAASRSYLETALAVLADPSDTHLADTISALARLFPSAVVNTWTLMVVVNAALAQGALTQFGHNRRPSPAFSEIELPRWLTIGILAAALGSLPSGQIGTVGQNALVVLALPFFFQGLAVIHALSGRMSARGMFLIVVYLILILFGWPAVLVTVIGLIEQWALLRRRFAAPGGGKEIE